MNGQHYTVIATALGAVALELAGVKNWHEVMTPQFLSGLILQAVATGRALYIPKIGAPAPEPAPVAKDAA